MSFSNLKKHISRLWIRFNESWSEAGEIQKRIDDAKTENIRRHGSYWRI